jgi:hypothetical protein
MGGLRISRNSKKESITQVEEPAGRAPRETTEAPSAQPSETPVRRRRSVRDRSDARARFLAEASGRRPKIVEIEGTRGDDEISVRRLRDGRVRVEQNGRVETYGRNTQLFVAAGEGNDRVRIRGDVDAEVDGGDGDDRINARRSIGILYAYGGEGDDRIRGGRGEDNIYGDQGNDRIAGGGGDDQLEGGRGSDGIQGNNGRDTVYGGRGDDRLSGGRGQDFLQGERGSDILRGGRGSDILSGFRGNDVLNGGAGADTLIGRSGEDLLLGGAGEDRTHERDTRIPDNIEIRGPILHRERVLADLEVLASTPSGRALLDDLAARGQRIVIEPGQNSAQAIGDDRFPSRGVVGTRIGYNPTDAVHANDDIGRIPPVVVLYHELVHAYDFAAGITRDEQRTDGVPNAENLAVGLPIDHDGDPSTPRTQPSPYYENLFREELGIPRRPRY